MTSEEERRRYETDSLMAARIGPRFGSRTWPRVRLIAGRRPWWRDVAGPFRTERAARREARVRLERRRGATAGVYSLPPARGRKLRRWYVAVLVMDSPRGLAARTCNRDPKG